MAFNDIERKRVENAVAAFVQTVRPPAHIRPKLDVGYRVENQAVFIFEIRPSFRDPDTKHEGPVAKAVFVRKNNHWKIYWMRQDLKWHSYPPKPIVSSLNAFFEEVSADPNACFWG